MVLIFPSVLPTTIQFEGLLESGVYFDHVKVKWYLVMQNIGCNFELCVYHN